MKTTTTTTTTALLLLLLHPRTREHIVCVGPICVIRPKGMCGAGSTSVAAAMTLFRSLPARALTPPTPTLTLASLYGFANVCVPRVYYSDFTMFRHMKLVYGLRGCCCGSLALFLSISLSSCLLRRIYIYIYIYDRGEFSHRARFFADFYG